MSLEEELVGTIIIHSFSKNIPVVQVNSEYYLKIESDHITKAYDNIGGKVKINKTTNYHCKIIKYL